MDNRYTLISLKKGLDELPMYNTWKKKIGKHIINFFVYLLLTQFVFVFLFPFLFMIVNSLKHGYELGSMTKEWVITNPNFNNYTEAIRLLNYWVRLKNSLTVSMFSTLGHLISGTFIAYGFARFKFRGRNVMFSLAMLSLIVPPQLLVMPLYIQFSKFGWIGSYLPIIIPTFFGFGLKGAMFIFVFRQFFKGLPMSYEESAKIEGCNPMTIFLKIILPIARTSILVVSILSIVWHWNDFFEPSIYVSGANSFLLSQAIYVLGNNGSLAFVTARGLTINPTALAGAFLVILPLLIIYFVFQKQFMKGIEFTGLAN